MTTIFSRTKDELKVILDARLTTPGTVQAVRAYRSYTLDVSPLLVITIQGYDQRLSDGAEFVDVTIATIAKFEGADEEEAAEDVLDNVEAELNLLFGPDDGEYQVHKGYWGAVDFSQPSTRPPSPFGPGTRYAEKYLRFVV